MSFLDKMKDKAKNIDFDNVKNKAKDMANNTKEKMKEIDVKETWDKTKNKFSKFSNQAELTLKLSDINEEFLQKDKNEKEEVKKEEKNGNVENEEKTKGKTKDETKEENIEGNTEDEEQKDKSKKIILRETTINLKEENKRMVINTFGEEFVAKISLNNDFNDKIFNLIDLNINYKITNISLENKKVKLAFDLDNIFEKYLENIL